MKTKTIALPTDQRLRAQLAIILFAVSAFALAIFAAPHGARAQGIVRGAQEGAYEGNRAAGPVGGAIGGAIGAGVGGAVGAVNGVLGIPDRGYRRHYRCRGYYTRSGAYRCYR